MPLSHVSAAPGVRFDRPGDGSIWACGKAYKASFSPSSATFIPFFGSGAPVNYPVALSVERLTVGGEPVAFAVASSPEVHGLGVAYDRGAFVERYDLAPDTLEQSFVLAQPLADGDLVLRMKVETELEISSAIDGLTFSNRFGAVVYGSAVVFDADGRSESFEIARASGAIELRVPAAFFAQARYPVTVDPVFSVFAVDTSAPVDFAPDVAYHDTQSHYLVVYERVFSASDHDVVARLLTSTGSLIVEQLIDISSTFWAAPRVATNVLASQFLTVAAAGPSGSRIIRGRTMLAVDGSMGSQFTIDGTAGGDVPVVGGDPSTFPPTYYCVVWKHADGSGRRVRYQLVRTDGTLLYGTPAILEAGAFQPEISKCDGNGSSGTQAWNVAFVTEPSEFDYRVRGAQIAWNGLLITPPFTIDAITGLTVGVSSPHDVASGSRPWIVAYEKANGGFQRDILVRAMIGSSIVASGNLSSLEAAAGSGTQAEMQISPAADCDGSKFVVTYSESYLGSATDYDSYVASIDLVGSSLILSEGHRNLGFTAIADVRSRVTANRSGAGPGLRCMLAWESTNGSLTTGDIHGALYNAPLFQSFCEPGADAMACPCGNAPSGPDRGCNNSQNTGGASLNATGLPSSDTVVLAASNMRTSATCIFLQGNAVSNAGMAFGDGVRCAAGSLKRLYVKTASGGAASAPTGSDPSIQTRSAQTGDPLQAGSTRWYQTYYRDPASYACASPATFNVTNGLVIDW